MLGVMSIGLALVIIAGHMDLSVESVAALSAMVGRHPVLLGRHRHRPAADARLAGGPGLARSSRWPSARSSALFNGLLIVKLKMNAFIVTLASYIWVRGLVLAISGGRSAQDLAPAIRWFGIQRLARPACSPPGSPSLCFVVFSLDHGQDAVRPAPDHHRRQRDRPPSAPASRSTAS